MPRDGWTLGQAQSWSRDPWRSIKTGRTRACKTNGCSVAQLGGGSVQSRTAGEFPGGFPERFGEEFRRVTRSHFVRVAPVLGESSKRSEARRPCGQGVKPPESNPGT